MNNYNNTENKRMNQNEDFCRRVNIGYNNRKNLYVVL